MNSVKKGFYKTSLYAVISQIISLGCGFTTSLLLPKLLGIEQFGFWQYFFLCSSYVGLLHFGFNDGIYLSLGGKRFVDINKEEYYPQLLLISCLQIMIALLLGMYSFFHENGEYQTIFYFLSIYIVVENIYKILSFVMMATDRMQSYSKTVVLDKLSFLLLLIVFFFVFKRYSFENVIYSYIGARAIALLVVFSYFRDLFDFSFLSRVFSKGCLSSVWSNMIAGISLTISNLLSTFIIGSGRFFVEHSWGISTFAKISFAVSLSMFSLIFISQIGLVLFPYLCRMDEVRQRQLLDILTFFVGVFSLGCFIGFIPLTVIVNLWIPKYVGSLPFLMILCPVALYETRMVLVFNTYFKTFRKQMVLLKINLLSVAFAILCYYIAAYLFKDINMIVWAMLVSLILRSYCAQYYLYRFLEVKQDKTVIALEFLASILMVVVYNVYDSIGLFIAIYLISIISMFCLRRNKIKQCLSLMKS